MSQPHYPGRLALPEIVRRLTAAIAAPDHTFWADSISLCSDRYTHNAILTPKILTDVYLLGLAQANGGRLITFDRLIPLRAVPGAENRHLVVL